MDGGVTGTRPLINFATCVSYTAATINLLNDDGLAVPRTIAKLRSTNDVVLWRWWRCGIERRTCDRQSAGSRASLRDNLGQVVHTSVPLSPSSIIWYRCNNLEGSGRLWKRCGLPSITLDLKTQLPARHNETEMIERIYPNCERVLLTTDLSLYTYCVGTSWGLASCATNSRNCYGNKVIQSNSLWSLCDDTACQMTRKNESFDGQ